MFTLDYRETFKGEILEQTWHKEAKHPATNTIDISSSNYNKKVIDQI